VTLVTNAWARYVLCVKKAGPYPRYGPHARIRNLFLMTIDNEPHLKMIELGCHPVDGHKAVGKN
jgi:hypothetical protein